MQINSSNTNAGMLLGQSLAPVTTSNGKSAVQPAPGLVINDQAARVVTQGGNSDAAMRALMDSAAKFMSTYVASSGRNLSVAVDDSANTIVIRVMSTDTGELIRQIPSEEVLAMMRYFNLESAGGLVRRNA